MVGGGNVTGLAGAALNMIFSVLLGLHKLWCALLVLTTPLPGFQVQALPGTASTQLHSDYTACL